MQFCSPPWFLLFSILVIEAQLIIDQNDGLSVLDQLGLPNLPSKASHATNKAYVDTMACTDIAFDWIQDIAPSAPGFLCSFKLYTYDTASLVWHCEYSFGTITLYGAIPLPLGMQLAANYIPFPLVNTHPSRQKLGYASQLVFGNLNSFGSVEFPSLAGLGSGSFLGTAGRPGAELRFPRLATTGYLYFSQTGGVLLPSLRSAGGLSFTSTAGPISVPQLVVMTGDLALTDIGNVSLPNLVTVNNLELTRGSVHLPQLSQVKLLSLTAFEAQLPALLTAQQIYLYSSTTDTLGLGNLRNWTATADQYLLYIDGAVSIRHLNLSSVNTSIEYSGSVACGSGSSFNVSQVTKPPGAISVAYCQNCDPATWSPAVRGLFVARSGIFPPCP